MTNFHTEDFQTCFRQMHVQEFSNFLIALAALQRDVKVTCFRQDEDFLTKSKAIFKLKRRFSHIQKLSLDGKIAYFIGPSSDHDNLAALSLARDKLRLKFHLARAQVKAPIGGAASSSDLKVLDTLVQAGVKRFTVKPIQGTGSKGVVTNLTPTRAINIISKTPGQLYLVEQYLKGTEFRIYVVGNRVVSALRSQQPYVTGDGKSTAQQLIDQWVLEQKNHPILMHRPINLIELQLAMKALEVQPTTVLNSGVVVPVSLSAQSTTADKVQCLSDLPVTVEKEALAAAKAIGSTACGMDIILDSMGVAFVIDVDSPGGIWHQCFPKQPEKFNLNVPHALLDQRLKPRKGPLRNIKFFDYVAMRDALHDPKRKTVGVNAGDFVEYE